MAAQLSLPPAMRMRDTRIFARIKSDGRRLASGCLIANWQVLSAEASHQLGVITPRRVGRAVDRTRARRLLRESFRLHQHDLRQPVALVLIARPSIRALRFDAVERDFMTLMSRARLLGTPA
jgi:ribonuclease P protein component